MQQRPGAPFTLFYSYAHEDESLRQRLETHLSLLQRQGLIAAWHDRQIPTGNEWAHDINKHLEAASIILLLISPDFLASNYCYEKEMQQALERHNHGEAHVIPIILRPCEWQKASFAHLQALPRNGKPVTTWENQDEAFFNIVQGLRQAIEQQQVPVHLPPEIERKNRKSLIQQVRTIWINGLLERSFDETTRLELHLQERPDALDNPWRLQVQELDRPPEALPADISIAEVYKEADGQLLILGKPGSGKTTLLLQLARTLLERADADDHLPIPVIFHLSSWAQRRQSLAEWLVEELWTKYQVPQKVGQVWIKADAILPLLDGLDEVAENARPACAQAINTYQQDRLQENGEARLVVCCRSRDYMGLPKRVMLRRAISIQPLTAQQIDDYLSSAGQALEEVRVALSDDSTLQELATNPLMLSILALAYHGKPIEDLLALPPENRRQRIFATYVQRMLKRRGIHTGKAPHRRNKADTSQHLAAYTQEQTRAWLAWLARQMTQRDQTIFYVENLETNWLSEKWQGWIYCTVLIMICWLMGGPIGWVSGNQVAGLVGGFVGMFICWIALALRSLLLGTRWSAPPPDDRSCLIYVTRFLIRMSIATVVCSVVSLVLMLVLLADIRSQIVLQIEFFGLVAIPLVYLQIRKTFFLRRRENFLTQYERWMVQNSGFSHRLAAPGIVLLSSLCSATAWFWLSGGSIHGSLYFLFYGFQAGATVVEYAMMRFLLWLLRFTPWNYSHFLDYAYEHILLRKVGRGYMFYHRLLLEHFATLEKKSP